MRTLLLTAIALLAVASVGCMRTNEIKYKIAMEEGWERVFVKPTDASGFISDGDTHVLMINTISGDSCEYLRHSGHVSDITWIKKPYTFWDDDVALYRFFHSAKPAYRLTSMQKTFGVNHEGKSIK